MTSTELMEALAPTMRYRRHLEGADFSLEANTEAVPEPGHFYVLRKGQVALQSDHFPEAIAAYHRLCRRYWLQRLQSKDPEKRLASAWGLVNLEPGNTAAATVIQEEGSNEDRKRLARIRSRPPEGRQGRRILEATR